MFKDITVNGLEACVPVGIVTSIPYSELGECPDRIRMDIYIEYGSNEDWTLCTRKSYYHRDYRIYDSPDGKACGQPAELTTSLTCEPFC